MDYADYDYKIGHQIFSWKYPIIWKRNSDYVRLLDDLAVLADEYLFCFVTCRLLMIPYNWSISISQIYIYIYVHDCFNLHWPTDGRIVGARLVRIYLPFFLSSSNCAFLSSMCVCVCVFFLNALFVSWPDAARGGRFPPFLTCDSDDYVFQYCCQFVWINDRSQFLFWSLTCLWNMWIELSNKRLCYCSQIFSLSVWMTGNW